MKDKERFDRKEYNLCVFFQRPDSEQVRNDNRYTHVIFTHAGFYTSYFGSIYEHVGGCLGFPQESSDKYLPANHVKIVLPIELDNSIRKAMKKWVKQYGSCVPFVVNVLKDLKILSEDFKCEGVDDLYFALKEYRFTAEQIKEWMKK